jgi:hypothetical protein
MAEQDEDRAAQRAAILQRRARLVACAVVTGVCAAAQGGCACLSPRPPEEEAGAGSMGMVDLSVGGEEAGGNGGATTTAGGEGGGEPRLCLSVR